MPSVQDLPDFYLPLIDITPFRENPRSDAAQQVIDDVRRACRSTGFFQMKGHGVSLELQKRVFEASAKFFALPAKEKLRLDARKNPGFRGYDVMGSQSYETEEEEQDGILRDVKEGFFISKEMPMDHPRVIQGRFLEGPNVWPLSDLLPVADFRSITEHYYLEMLRVSRIVFDLLAATLPCGSDCFDDLQAKDPMWLLRLLHYPPTPGSQGTAKMQLGAGEHTDFGAITLLVQDEHPGLQVKDYKTDQWVDVPPNPDVYIVNLGDVMSLLTGGEYRSSLHRVWNKSSDDRYSIVFFFDGNLDTKLKPLDGLPVQLQSSAEFLTVEEHVRYRMTGSYSIVKN
ncbi:hypothetical protein ASPFODRAFT_51568 [Aspergillus luchuensis CBS 106.47]|uniref:Fe2OG dioxygenase domain-containing protein n=1 Tax=Aspergillus luchuensis (strain CBS 106.47) TaxID=1137211 RepID=A0A1M3T558_ASPLC|nr:hypothetical protein ASPFODRAFT_51568 [Aspergillus luchuensis CBS 106.47]